MKTERFKELLANKEVIKIGTIGGGFFKDKNNTIVIQFFFYHPGNYFHTSSLFNSRIDLSYFPLDNLIEEINPVLINESILILANADVEAYALSYRISINVTDKIISVVLVDMPESGERLISDDEKNGIELHFG